MITSTLNNIECTRVQFLLEKYFSEDVNLYLSIYYKINHTISYNWIRRRIVIKIYNLFTLHIEDLTEIKKHSIPILYSLSKNIQDLFDDLSVSATLKEKIDDSWSITEKRIAKVIVDALPTIEENFNKSIMKYCKPQ